MEMIKMRSQRDYIIFFCNHNAAIFFSKEGCYFREKKLY